MATSRTRRSSGRTTSKVLSVAVAVIGAFMLIGGALAWTMTSAQLADQHMTVAPYSEDNPGKYAGEPIDGPITAWVQADVIDTHALEATEGKTYAQMDREDPVRQVAMDGALLRGALFTSVLAFGVAAMAMGLGLTLLLIGAALGLSLRAPRTATEQATRPTVKTAEVTGPAHAMA